MGIRDIKTWKDLSNDVKSILEKLDINKRDIVIPIR